MRISAAETDFVKFVTKSARKKAGGRSARRLGHDRHSYTGLDSGRRVGLVSPAPAIGGAPSGAYPQRARCPWIRPRSKGVCRLSSTSTRSRSIP